MGVVFVVPLDELLEPPELWFASGEALVVGAGCAAGSCDVAGSWKS